MSSISRTIKTVQEANEAIKWVLVSIIKGLAGGAVVVTLGREQRTKDQNAKLWPMLTDISGHVVWYEKKHSADVWKDIITGSFLGGEFVPNIDGTGFVVVGLSTRKMKKPEFSNLIEYIYAFGADQQVIWSEKSNEAFEQYRNQGV
tara:strand:+ start:337 stop:774 length:438 start_codon:yes stop_codon:yes gene_type:complete